MILATIFVSSSTLMTEAVNGPALSTLQTLERDSEIPEISINRYQLIQTNSKVHSPAHVWNLTSVVI